MAMGKYLFNKQLNKYGEITMSIRKNSNRKNKPWECRWSEDEQHLSRSFPTRKEAEQFDARITRAVLQNDVLRAVGRGVERENDFVVLRYGRENRTEAPEEFRDIFFLLINGDDDAEEHD